MPRITLPSAQGGLNLRDSLDNMPAIDCLQMDNVIPDVSEDRVRSGFNKVSDFGANRLIRFENNVLAADNSKVSLINTSTGADTLLKDGFFSSDWKYTAFQTAGGNPLIILANGVDTVQQYDGATLEDSTYTGTDLTNLESPLTFKNRTYFVKRDSLSFFYSGVQSISGDLKEFSVRGFARKGGSILTIESWSQDAGEGLTNLFAVFTTEGEVLIYGGDDPEADNWALKGVFEISKPIGKRCCLNYGSDVIVITEQGYLPLASVLSQDKANIVPVSDKINSIVKGKDFTDRNWSMHWYSNDGWLFINAPSSTRFNYEQHVLNIKTNAWCRFVGMDAIDWVVVEDKIYFCNTTGIYKANDGTTDDGNPINYVKQQAYSKLNGEKVKGVQRVKIRYNTVGAIEYATRIGVDFDLGTANFLVGTSLGVQSYWDEAIWDVSFWSDTSSVRSYKGSVFAPKGEYISIGYFGNSEQGLSFYSADVLYEAGNGDF
ncbi:MAG: hypothetical protein Unbinned6284contig1004_59 [Prokaryotic dsDNA virus sp.]|nr:MAG: hypothetical protein Unbinned6284contig1004_59 [Prokaryotic dsDNA virus sp.]|tara:strand:+ start:16948 stop:18411 length:1464 start_codon:yes stop_codon:yes gene_type:complete